MPEISRFYGIIISMYYNDHNPPHFHVHYGEFMAEIAIQTLDVIDGQIPHRAKILVLEWASEHKDELLKNWELRTNKLPLQVIEPLP